MALDDLNPEELYDRTDLGKRIADMRLITTGALIKIDRIFENIETEKLKFAGEPDVITYLDGLTAELKLAMFTIYNKY